VEDTGPSGRLHWIGVVLLALVTVLMSAVEPVPLVLMPLSLLLLGLPPREWRRIALGAALWLMALLFSGGPLGTTSLAWATVLAGMLLGVTQLRPEWSWLTRSLVAVGASLGICAVWLFGSGQWAGFDAFLLEHFRRVAGLTLEQLRTSLPNSPWTEQFAAAGPRVAQFQWMVFPAVLALQSLAALGVAAWMFGRLDRSQNRWPVLRPLREFRFNDQLIWLLIAGLVAIVLPLDGIFDRIGWNALLFMGSLYALRGVAVFAFLAAGLPTAFSVMLAVFATLFLYPIVLTAALLVGVGDTWLDVRGRAASAAKT
jgi:hypothetical protein